MLAIRVGTGLPVKVKKIFVFSLHDEAIAMGQSEGLIKTVFDADTGELMGTVFPHPTLSEMMNESVLDAFGQVIHF